MKAFLIEFKQFLEEYKVIGLAIAFIMGSAATTLVKSLVDNLLMPLFTPFIPDGAWQSATLNVWKFAFGLGAFAGALLNFMILAFVIFLIAKFVLKEEKVTKK